MAVWTRRLPLGTELNWTDGAGGISRDVVKDWPLVGEEEGKGHWVNGGSVP